MKVKIRQTDGQTEVIENAKKVRREEHGVLIIKERREEVFIPYQNLSFYLTKQ